MKRALPAFAAALCAFSARAQTPPPPAVVCDPLLGCRAATTDDSVPDPQPVFPAVQNVTPILDLTNGATADLLTKTISVAFDLWVVAFVLALLWETFGTSPTAQRDYAGVVFRGVGIALLLLAYRPIFGTVIQLTQEIATRIAPPDAHAKFAQLVDAAANTRAAETDPAAAAVPPLVGMPPPSLAQAQQWSSALGGFLFSGALGLLIMLGAAIHWVLRMFSVILATFYYIIGPLALVAGMPRISGVGSKWFGHFVTVASWPIFSALLLAITTQIAGNGLFGQESFGALCSALIMIVTAIATPTLAGKFLGGSSHVVDQGAAVAMKAFKAAAGGAKAMAVKAAAGAAAKTGAAASGAGSSGGASGQTPASNPVP